MAGTILRSTFRLLLLLLTVVVLAAVGSKNEKGSVESALGFATTPTNTNNTEIVTATRKNEPGKLSAVASTADAENEKASWGEVGEEEDSEDEDSEDDEEGDDEGDEYEEELRGIAESHEAMSRDERRNGISSSPVGIELVSENRSVETRQGGTKNFDSREKSTESGSDESSVSNEAMPKDEDEEVAQLLKYKQKGTTTLAKEDIVGGISKLGSKVKRVPTVKKELSTQKEIIASNETQIPPKDVVSDVDVVNRLDEETRQERGYSIPIMARDPLNQFEHLRSDINLEAEYTDVDTPGDLLRKLDKRQPTELNGLSSYLFLGGYPTEREQQRKLQELGIEEGILAESLMEVLTRLAEDPRRWERVHRLLQDVEGGLELPQTSLPDWRKRAYTHDSPLEIPITESPSQGPAKPPTSKKPKKKKKKKKPRHRFGSTTSTTGSTTITTTPTPIPLTPSLITTTESPWPTTPAQWRLVAERLFGSPWSDAPQDVPSSSLAKVRYAATAKQRGSTGSASQERLLPIDEKQRDSLKALNNERQALMLQSAREYSQPRRLHYGKVNTHEKGSPGSSHDDPSKNYDTGSPARVLDYDIAERNYQRPMALDRYDHYGQYNRQRPGNYEVNPAALPRDDYDDDDVFRYPDGMTNRRPFARTQPFRPLGREYASTKTWQDSRYDYSRPWKDKSRSSLDGMPDSGVNWPWRNSQSNYKMWVPRYQPWSRERNYPQRVGNVDDELEDIEDYMDNEEPASRNWQRNSQHETWRTLSGSSGWPIDGKDGGPAWSVPERAKSYSRATLPGSSLEKNKNRSELSGKELTGKLPAKEKPMLPKITMKTWNSLTSDPATWPFKLNGAKPWPKDKNGKSYNPNAELVRKLGLDKQDRMLSSTKDAVKDLGKDSSKFKVGNGPVVGANGQQSKASNLGKGSMSWPAKLSDVNGWTNGKPRETERLPQRDEVRDIWHGDVETERKMWPGKSPVSSKMSPVGSWAIPADQSTWKPYEIKNPAYGQLSEGPRGRWPDRTSHEDTVRGPWSPQKINNDWNAASGYSGEKSAPSNGHSSTWPSKWRQFAYHKVTAAPVTKPGSLNQSDGTGRARNSYIAVSAVAAPKYSNNEWRKNDIEETQLDRGSSGHGGRFDQDDPSSQLRKSSVTTKELWNQQRGNSKDRMGKDRERHENDPLEHQLEELRPYWNHEHLRQPSQKRSDASGVSTSTVAPTQTSSLGTNSTTILNEKSEKKPEVGAAVDTEVQQKKDVMK